MAASYFSDITLTVAMTPSDFVWQGFMVWCRSSHCGGDRGNKRRIIKLAKFIRVAKHAKIPKLLKSLKNPVLNFLVPLASKDIGHIIKKLCRNSRKGEVKVGQATQEEF